MFHFFLFFGREMIRVICTMLALAIKDLEVCMDNSNLPMRIKAIWFKPSAQKRETGKQTAGILYYQY